MASKGTHYEDRCSVDGCPEPNSEEWHHCFVCRKGEGDHQHFPKKSLAGKGAKIVAFLCRYHHERITLHEWREGLYTHPDGSVRYYVQNQKGEEQCERIIEAAPTERVIGPVVMIKAPLPDELREALLAVKEEEKVGKKWGRSGEEVGVREILPVVKEEIPVLSRAGAPPILELDLSVASDEDLARLFAEADKKQAESFLAKCKIIHAYRERHVRAWGQSWTEQAYELFDGSPSRRTLEAYANIWTCVATDASLLEHIGPLTDSRNLMQFIGRKNPEDGIYALETAVQYLAEFGEAPTVPALAQKLGEESKPDLCPKTGLPHNWERRCKDCKETR